MKKPDLTRYAPPGIPLRQERTGFLTGLTLATLSSLLFFSRYTQAHSTLYRYHGEEAILIPTAVMPDFPDVLDGTLLGFPLLALCMAGLIFYHYAYHIQGSKSLYLMRRLPDRWELHRRCLTLPLLGALFSLLFGGLLLLLYFWFYMAVTPPSCLSPGQWSLLLSRLHPW